MTDDVLSILTIDLSPTGPGIPTSGPFAMAGKFMVPLHICARKWLFTASADSLDLSQVNLVHTASVAIFLDFSRASRPSALHFLLAALCNGEMQLLVAAS